MAPIWRIISSLRPTRNWVEFVVVALTLLFVPLHAAQAAGPIAILLGIATGFLGIDLLPFDIPFLKELSGTGGELLFKAILAAFSAILGMFTQILQALFVGLGELMGGAIQYFINIPIAPSNDATPQFVKEAWAFTRNLTTLLVLIVVAVIGFATILRWQNFRLQSTLPLLIGVVLLINFSGVLVGLVTDIANIITNFFLEKITDVAWQQNPFSKLGTLEGIGINFARIIYYNIAALVFFLVMLLFALRTIILWTLVILAPLAFLAYVLPATRSFFQSWWKNLLQWAMLGIPISFFLFLAGAVLDTNYLALPPGAPGVGEFAVSPIAAFFAPVTSLVLLFIGVMLSISFAPAGSQAVINWGKKAGFGAYRGLGKKGASWTRSRMAESGTVQKAAQRLEQSTSRDGGWRAKTIGRPFMPFARATGRTIGSKNLQALKAQSALAEADAAKMDEATVASLLKGTDPVEKKIGYINAKIKSGDIDDVRKAFGKDEFDAFLGRVYGQAEERGAHKDMQAAFSHLIPNLQIQRSIAAENLGIPISRVTYTQAAAVTPAEVLAERQSMLRGMRPDRVKQMSAGVFDHDDALDRMLTSWDGRHMGNFLTQHGQRGVDALERRLHALAPAPNTPRSWLTANNPGLLHYIDSQAGQQLGFTI